MTLHVFLSCTKTKKERPNPRLLFRTVPHNQKWEVRQDNWIKRLAAEDSLATHRAIDLYSGGGWEGFRRALKANNDDKLVSAWIISAGYGFISANEKIHSYSATFLDGDDDFIASDSELNKKIWWWDRINQKLNKNCSFKKISDLAKRNPNDYYVFAVPQSYLIVIKEDLKKLETMVKKNHLTILLIGENAKLKGLRSVLKLSYRLNTLFGGVLSNLHIRIASYVIEKLKDVTPDFKNLEKLFNSLSCSLKPLQKRQSQKLSDDEVGLLVLRMMERNSKKSATHFLKILRKEGYSCEQRRFQKIFNASIGS